MKATAATLFAAAFLLAAPSTQAQTLQKTGVRPVPDIAAQAAAEYRQMARYPEWCQPVPDGQPDPLKAKRVPSHLALPRDDGGALEVWSSDIRFEKGDTAIIHARLVTPPGKDADMPRLRGAKRGLRGWKVGAVITGRQSGEVGKVTLRDDGLGVDRRRGDGIYTGSFTLPAAHEPPIGQAESLAVIVTARNSAGDEMKAVGGFQYSHPAAHLTGRVRDRLEDGNLVILAEAQVEAAGRFHLSASLHDVSGKPLATAQNAVRLEPGIHWIPLEFFGLAMSDRGASGPFWIDSMSLNTVSGIPNALGPMLENVHLTHPYRATAFHRRAFNRPDLIRAAERLERVSAARRARQR
ncbi:MAG: hypothetical protein D6757_08515 [Alphaproteobacteria bacterium]|nr:MAG: hypothetical protein D6757_08515 [Alphaproteobacteria bacterium]